MKTKKILAGALAAAVVTTSLPGMGVPVFAADSFLTPDSNCYTTNNPFAFQGKQEKYKLYRQNWQLRCIIRRVMMADIR